MRRWGWMHYLPEADQKDMIEGKIPLWMYWMSRISRNRKKLTYVAVAILFLGIGFFGNHFWNKKIASGTTSLLPNETYQVPVSPTMVEGPNVLPIGLLMGVFDLDEPDLICGAYQKYIQTVKQKVEKHRVVVGTGAKIISTMQVGDSGYTVPWGMLVDIHGHCYLNGNYDLSDTRGGTVQMRVVRTPQGYCVYASDASAGYGSGHKEYEYFWEPVNDILYVGGKIDHMIPILKVY